MLMFAQERHRKILRLLEKHGRMELPALLDALKVSTATLRRDLAFLDRTEALIRVHGGVLHPRALAEPTIGQKKAHALTAKRAIGAACAKAVPEGATVFIDSGSTCLEAALRLRERADLTLITNSLPIAAAHEQFRGRILLPGGEIRSVSGALVGPGTLWSLGRLRADVAIIGASGLHADDGPSTTETGEAAVKREWIARSQTRFLLADASKWARPAAVAFARWDVFDRLFTDAAPTPNCPPCPVIVCS